MTQLVVKPAEQPVECLFTRCNNQLSNQLNNRHCTTNNRGWTISCIM